MAVSNDERRKRIERLAFYGALVVIVLIGLIVVGVYHMFKSVGVI